MSIEISHAYRFTCRFTKLTRNQQGREMIARRHVPFTCADENSRLLCRHGKVPSSILDGIRCRDKGHRRGIGFAEDALINLRGFRSRGDASIGLRYNFPEARKSLRKSRTIGVSSAMARRRLK